MEDEVKPVITIAKYQDRVVFDGTAERAAEIHGKGSVYVDGKCYAEILKEQEPQPDAQPEQAPADEAPPVDATPEVAAESAGDAHA